jgi:hypothetical protein
MFATASMPPAAARRLPPTRCWSLCRPRDRAAMPRGMGPRGRQSPEQEGRCARTPPLSVCAEGDDTAAA